MDHDEAELHPQRPTATGPCPKPDSKRTHMMWQYGRFCNVPWRANPGRIQTSAKPLCQPSMWQTMLLKERWWRSYEWMAMCLWQDTSNGYCILV
jgi:hypothetical protein